MNISKRTAIILIFLTTVLLIGLFLFLYFSPDKKISPIEDPNTPSTNSPFGDTSQTNTGSKTQTLTQNPQNETPAEDRPTETLRQIFSEPVSGAIVYTKNKDTVARFVERSNGNIHESKKDSPQIIRISNKTIPKIQEAVWDRGGNSLILRYLSEGIQNQIDSFSAKIKISTSTSNEFLGEITGSFLSANIAQIAVGPTTGKIAYSLRKTDGSGSNIYTSNTDGSSRTLLADIPLSEINVSWPKNNIVSVLTKPSSKYAGFLYFINTNEGILRKIIGDIWGLSTLVDSSATKIIYSKITRGIPVLYYYNLSTFEENNLEINTFAEKCVWARRDSGIIYCAIPSSITSSGLPDTWYQGKISFADNIWKINLETGESSEVYNLQTEDLSIDATSLAIGEKDDFLIFTNKTDLSLWGLILE